MSDTYVDKDGDGRNRLSKTTESPTYPWKISGFEVRITTRRLSDNTEVDAPTLTSQSDVDEGGRRSGLSFRAQLDSSLSIEKPEV